MYNNNDLLSKFSARRLLNEFSTTPKCSPGTVDAYDGCAEECQNRKHLAVKLLRFGILNTFLPLLESRPQKQS